MTEPKVTQEQLDLMRHTVGMDRRKTPYRNHFFADEGHVDWFCLIELVKMGLMTKHESSISPGFVFQLTDQGCWMLGIPGTGAITA